MKRIELEARFNHPDQGIFCVQAGRNPAWPEDTYELTHVLESDVAYDTFLAHYAIDRSTLAHRLPENDTRSFPMMICTGWGMKENLDYVCAKLEIIVGQSVVFFLDKYKKELVNGNRSQDKE